MLSGSGPFMLLAVALCSFFCWGRRRRRMVSFIIIDSLGKWSLCICIFAQQRRWGRRCPVELKGGGAAEAGVNGEINNNNYVPFSCLHRPVTVWWVDKHRRTCSGYEDRGVLALLSLSLSLLCKQHAGSTSSSSSYGEYEVVDWGVG